MNQFIVKVIIFNILIITLAHGWLLPTSLKKNEEGNGKTGRKRDEDSKLLRDAGDPWSWSAFKSGWITHRRPGRSFIRSCKYYGIDKHWFFFKIGFRFVISLQR